MHALVVRNLGAVELSIAPEAIQRKADAVAVARGITAVINADGQAVATRAVQTLRVILKELENSREEVKRPVLDIGRKIDATAKTYAAELIAEADRVLGLVNEFYREEQRKAAAAEKVRADLARKAQERADRERAAEQARQRELERQAKAELNNVEQERLRQEAERRKQEQALRDAEMQRRQEEAEARAPVEAPKAAGMVVRTEWKFRVVSCAELYEAHPDYCRLEPNLSKIAAAVRVGLRDCPGLEIYEDTSATVRTS